MNTPRVVSERTLVFLIGAVQFVNILDFVMVMPLGPDFARALGIPASKLGLVGGSYTAAAAVAGVIGSLFLDRFDRRRALAVALAGLGAGTLAGSFARDLPSLMAARVLAGLFGGPATSLALAIVADAIPPERRGKAMGAIMGAFSAASVLGVPAGLELARRFGWRAPFVAVAGLGFAVTTGVIALLPPMRHHLLRRGPGDRGPRLAELLERPLVWLSLSMTATVMLAGFLLIPNLSAYVQENLGLPRAQLSTLYLVGGVVSFFATRFGGRLVDKIGSFRTGSLGAGLLLIVLWVGFVRPAPELPVLALYVGFMLALGLRNVSYNTLTTKVPSERERARFLSIQSAVQHAASATGAIGSAQLLSERADHQLVGMPVVAGCSMALTLLAPLLLALVERGVKQAHPH